MNILAQIVDRKRAEVATRAAKLPLDTLKRVQFPGSRRDFAAALRAPGISVIAEIKRRSPSKGLLRETLDPAELARTLQGAGAHAISVLTDRDFFGGSDDDLKAALASATIPLLRKDFTIDPYQIWEARALGASAILLIARILGESRLRELVEITRECGLAALVETHVDAEVQCAIAAGAEIIGVNARNLDTFATDFETVFRLRGRIPAGVLSVAESAIRTREDVQRAQDAGFDAILVGETLMRAHDPAAKLHELLGSRNP